MLDRITLAIVLAGIAVAIPRTTYACGGTFCDAGGLPIPVDQSGETVLFVRDGEHVEAHIQIAYTGDPDEFAWIVPVPAPPVFSVGSQALFDRLRAATQPSFSTDTAVEPCDEDDEDDADDGGGGDVGCGGGFSFGPLDLTGYQDEDPPEWEPDAAGQLVGAYDVELLEAGSVDEVERWIVDHDFQPDADAPAVLQEYIDEGFVFAAFTLRDGADLDEIHPLVIRYRGSEPCLPLRLTRIAAVEDMPVRIFALDDARMVPTNYMHVELDPVRMDWLNPGDDYDAVVASAVDETGNGHGFVTEYAGTSDVASQAGLVDQRWDAAAFVGLGAIEALVELDAQGFSLCVEPDCTTSHPLLDGLLERWIVVPDGLDRDELLRCPSCFTPRDFAGWDSIGFAADFEARITQPGWRALELLQTRPWLTALYTRISPAEMTVDPMFHTNPDLGTVSDEHVAHLDVRCKGIDRVTLPDGREVGIEDGEWPSFDDDVVPYAEVLARVPERGPAILEVDASKAIDEALISANNGMLHRTHAKPTQISVEWGGWVEPDDEGCGACTTRGKRPNVGGPLWMLLLLTIALRMRRPPLTAAARTPSDRARRRAGPRGA